MRPLNVSRLKPLGSAGLTWYTLTAPLPDDNTTVSGVMATFMMPGMVERL